MESVDFTSVDNQAFLRLEFWCMGGSLEVSGSSFYGPKAKMQRSIILFVSVDHENDTTVDTLNKPIMTQLEMMHNSTYKLCLH